GARTNFNIRNQPKVESNATIFVHGISGHSYGWSSGFEASLNARASNQDYYEFTWSGFAATGGVGINSIAGDIATDSLVDAIGAIRQKGYRNINIVAHSWGTVLSRDAQNEEGGAINTWVTMGSPLSASTNKPAGVGYWLNMWARYDWFAHELGSLYKNPGVDEQFRVDDVVEEYSLKNHSAYWTDMRALDKIGNQISGQ
ncbi:MAG: alpha/beta hydrolase, partial [Desulfobacterales bacterium]|nr:alpha/beta hydrolase [Desulfobacterales bacterium]